MHIANPSICRIRASSKFLSLSQLNGLILANIWCLVKRETG